MTAQRLLAIAQPCSDLQSQTSWYCDRLGFKEESRDNLEGAWIGQLFGCSADLWISRSILSLGCERLQLWQWESKSGVDSSTQLMRPTPADSRSNDRWFQHICMVTRNLGDCFSGPLQSNTTMISKAVQTLPEWNQGAAGIQAVKFMDPQGHPLELLEFPADKGNPRWHTLQSGSSQPMGIDHTAIGISDTPTSLRFYRDLLGLRLIGGSVNHGPEQDGLDGLDQTMVEISSLRPVGGEMGIEFLNYQQPAGGRNRSDAQITDLCDWKILIESSSVEEQHVTLQDSEWAGSCGPLVELDPSFCGKAKGFFVRDPDKHAVIVLGD